jgi:UPF0755 protein
LIPKIKEKINKTIKETIIANKKIIPFNILEFFLVITIFVSYYITLPLESKRVVFIPKGSTSYIISYLDKNHYDLNFIDTMIVKSIGYPQSGWIDLKHTHMTKLDFLYKITTSKAALVNITLIPGETYYFFLNDIANKLKIEKTKLFDIYNNYAYKKDGNILPQTYALPIGMNPEDLIQYLFNYTDTQYEKYSLKIFGKYEKEKWYKYITIASIIQKESASKEEMTKISSVIYNRLNENMKLQMDGTLNYGRYSHMKVTPQMIKEDLTPYNTYKYKGIPSDPICAVEFEAIKAAIFPAKTDYLYFVKAIDGNRHIFSKTYKSHKKYIQKIIKSKRKSNKKKPKNVYKKLHSTKKSPNNPKRISTKNLWKSVN